MTNGSASLKEYYCLKKRPIYLGELTMTMTRKEYQKPFMVVERFVAQEYCAPCNWQGKYTSSAYIYDSNNKLYLDKNDNKRYDSGEQINTPAPPSDKTFIFSYNENNELGYVDTSSITGNIFLTNLIPTASHKYYTYYQGNRNEYENERKYLYALKAVNGKTYWFSGNSFTFSKLHS